MAPTLENTVLEQVRIGRQVHLASDFLDGETEALRSDLPHNEDFCLFVFTEPGMGLESEISIIITILNMKGWD